MVLKFKHLSDDELKSRRAQILSELDRTYLAVEGAPMSLRDYQELADMGCLSVHERKLYDELSRIEFLLGH